MVVTATRRSENLQNVPIAITALTSNTLSELNVQTLEDFVKYLPNVSTAGTAPGQNEVYMRGLATTHQGTSGRRRHRCTFPNVAVYLDDQSVQLPGRNLDVYAADLARIEVLEGPQGTLVWRRCAGGRGALHHQQAEARRDEGSVDASYSTTAHGDPNASGVAMINIPVIPDTLALRAVIYDDSRGGYIHNVPGTFYPLADRLRASSTISAVSCRREARACPTHPVSATPSIPLTYQGARVSGLVPVQRRMEFACCSKATRAWRRTVCSPTIRRSAISRCNSTIRRVDIDKFEDTAWTLNGRAGPLKLVYTGGYLVRNVDQTADYTNYSRGPFAAYYQCNDLNSRPPRHGDLLLTELHLAQHREKHASEPRISREHARRGALARDRRHFLGRVTISRPRRIFCMPIRRRDSRR